MKVFKPLFFYFIGSVLLFSSCSNDDEETAGTGLVEKILCVESESIGESGSRAYVDSYNSTTGVAILWEDDDKIGVIPKGTSKTYDFTRKEYSTDTKRIAYFSGLVDKEDLSKDVFVFYPYSGSTRIVNGLLQHEIPHTQHATKKEVTENGAAVTKATFDPKAGIQLGVTNGSNSYIELSHLCAYIVLTVKKGNSDGCTGISLKAVDENGDENTNWHLAGQVQIDPSSASTAIKGFGSRLYSTIELDNIDSSAEVATYFIAFVPASGQEGKTSPLHVTVNYGDQKRIRAIKLNQYAAGHFYNVGTFEPKAQTTE